jgi:hypothetical protein
VRARARARVRARVCAPGVMHRLQREDDLPRAHALPSAPTATRFGERGAVRMGAAEGEADCAVICGTQGTLNGS